MRLSQIQNNILRQLIANVNLTKGVLAINGAGAATFKTTNALTYTVDGVLLTKAALAAQVFTVDPVVQARISGQAVFYVQPINSTVYYVVGLDAAGNCRVFQGIYNTYVGPGPNPILGDATTYVGVPEDIGSYCPVGIIKIVTNGAATFNPGVTLLDAAGLTVTYVDVCMLPSANP